MSYAEGTTVALEKSISGIITLIKRAGASAIGQFEDDEGFAIQFAMQDRRVRFRVPFVTEYTGPIKSGNGKIIDQRAWLEQRKRQRGRALLLVIKAKLESVESGVETLEEAFLAQVVTPTGQTVYERVSAPLALEYEAGVPGAGLLGGPA